MANSRLRAAGPAAVAPLGPEEELLRKLRAGEIDQNTYYDEVVELGIAQLKKRLKPDELELLRERMREEVASNPVLVQMLENALREKS